ncbi:hypothetical protein AB4Z19_12930 [Pseudoduganella sp. RAF19]|jgi:hypothetical protein|uniref:hypothetical protein n=1 Tax=Pseudoduganella sp. RAF19 TaxID=3233052 RepID=UPI003F969D7D
MKKIAILGAIAALSLAASASVLAAGPQDPTVQISAGQASRYYMPPSSFDEYAGRFALDNGQQLRLSRHVNHYYVELTGEQRAELTPVGPNAFVTDAGARVELRDLGDTVAISNYEKLPMAVAMKATNVMMVAKR